MLSGRIPLRSKLFALVAPPLLALFAFTSLLLASRWDQRVQTTALREAIDVARAATLLVHESQVESDLTIDLLSLGGERAQQQVREQRARADARVRELATAAALASDSFPPLHGLGEVLERHTTQRSRLRSRIDAGTVNPDSVPTLYADLDQPLIELMGSVSASASDGEIANITQVAYRFVQAKAAADLERAVLGEALRSGGFSPELFGRHARIVALTGGHLEFFERGAPPPIREKWEQMKGQGSLVAADRIRNAAVSAFIRGTPTTIRPETWFDAQRATLVAMHDIERSLADAAAARASSVSSAALRDVIITSLAVLLTLVITVHLTLTIVQGVLRDVLSGVSAAEHISTGRLDVTFDTSRSDEIGRLHQAMSTMQQRLNAIVSRLLAGADEVMSSSDRLSEHGRTLTTHATEQASAVQELASSMEEISSTTQASAESAKQAADLAKRSAAQASEGSEVADRAMTAMTAIRENATRIEDILDVINDIAFQTNILALNAAVEAARAGEHGRGFAVVADEVQRLSERTTTSAKDVRVLVEQSRKAVEDGSGWVGRSVNHLRTIADEANIVNDLVGELASTSVEQSAALSQINDVLGNIDVVAQQTATMVEDLGNASAQVSRRATETREVLSFFEVDGVIPDPITPSEVPEEPEPTVPSEPVALLTSNHPDEWVAIDEETW